MGHGGGDGGTGARRGYPASDYVETGTTRDVTWSLQLVLQGRVRRTFNVGHAEQLRSGLPPCHGRW